MIFRPVVEPEQTRTYFLGKNFGHEQLKYVKLFQILTGLKMAQNAPLIRPEFVGYGAGIDPKLWLEMDHFFGQSLAETMINSNIFPLSK